MKDQYKIDSSNLNNTKKLKNPNSKSMSDIQQINQNIEKIA